MQMKTRILMIVMVLLASAPLFAAHAQGPPPPPAKDYFPKTWDEYSFPALKFRIRLPDKPVESVTTEDGIQIHSIEYQGLISYRVAFVDYGATIDDPQTVKEILPKLKTAALDSIRDKGLRIVADREVTVDGHAGIFVHVEVGGNEVVRMQWVPVGSRLYTISTTSRKGSPLEMEGKDDYEKVVVGFIGSFHVIP